MGSQISGRLSMRSTPGGMMPMTSWGRPSTFTVRSDERLSAEGALPQLVREDRDRRSSQARAGGHRVGFSRAEEPSVRRLNPERVEQVLVHRSRTHAQRPIACGEVHFTGPRSAAAAGVALCRS